MFLLILALLLRETACCSFNFYPDVITSSIQQTMTVKLRAAGTSVPSVSQKSYQDGLTGNTAAEFSFIGELTQDINPRLCRWTDLPTAALPEPAHELAGAAQLDQAERERTIIESSRGRERQPLSAEFGMPDIRCVDETGKPGQPISRFGKFTGFGAALDPFTGVPIERPLCGDAVNLKKGQLLEFSGSLQQGVRQILECHVGWNDTPDTNTWLMVPLFVADCSQPTTQLTYDALFHTQGQTQTHAPGASPSQQPSSAPQTQTTTPSPLTGLLGLTHH